MSGLRYLGKDGLPALINILENGDAISRGSAARCVEIMFASGVDIREAMPGLLLYSQVYVLELGHERDFLVPVLTNCLEHANASVRVRAAECLGYLGQNGVGAEPALNRAFEDPDEGVREAATNAVKRIAQDVIGSELEKVRAYKK